MIPLFSTFTLFTEFLVTAGILYVFYSGYRHNRFPYLVAGITLGYEVLFNITYMASRILSHANPSALESKLAIGLAIFHGTFSLLMFLELIVFIILAWRNYKKGINYFAVHRTFTIVFIVLWLIAVLSGFLFYYVSYLR